MLTEVIPRIEEMGLIERDDRFYVEIPDPNTGELVEVEISMGDPRRVLYAMGQTLRRLDKMDENVSCQATMEIEYIKERARASHEQYQAQAEQLRRYAQPILDTLAMAGIAPLDAQERPFFKVEGVGKFSYRKAPVSVDDSTYAAMTEDQATELQLAYKDVFRVKTTVSPDKAAIKEGLKAGVAIPGFRLVGGQPEFGFKSQ